jgi:hypothetical protein
MIEDDDALIIDRALAKLPELLKGEGMIFVQKKGFMAGKLKPKGRFSNWCQLVDGTLALNVRFPNRHGQVKTWKLFARFDVDKAPSKPWDRPERYSRKKAQWMLGGDDVWGVAYEDIEDLAKEITHQQFLQCLIADLRSSFQYSQGRYMPCLVQ